MAGGRGVMRGKNLTEVGGRSNSEDPAAKFRLLIELKNVLFRLMGLYFRGIPSHVHLYKKLKIYYLADRPLAQRS